jgi:hypothetical protein
MLRLILTLFMLFFALLRVSAQAATPCPDLPPRLIVGEWARVTYDNAVNFRPQPTVNIARLDALTTGITVEVLDGPVCADGYHWWQIDYDGETGWVAEGAGDEYWLEPRGILQAIEDEDGIERVYVVDAEREIIERAGCMRPPEDYTQLEWGFATFNARTVAMLQQAQRLYSAGGGFVRFEDMIVQGSYNPGVDASFGTHDGGGAVDISVRSKADFSVLTTEIAPMLDALRTAGFAAWLRAPDELYPGSPIHIHAVAVGDAEASEAARGQIDGEFGYLRGYNGLPQPEGEPPVEDIYGDPVICAWMIEDGFEDLRD